MAKIEKAYSLELGRNIDAVEAHELWTEGVLIDKKAFKCRDANCGAQITCANMDKKKSEMKRTPYFQCHSPHDRACKFINEYEMVQNLSTQGRGGGKDISYSNNIDYFHFERPKNHGLIQNNVHSKSGGETERKYRSEKNGVRKVHIGNHYSLTPIVAKYLLYGKEADKNYVRIMGRDISYEKLFMPVDSIDIRKLPQGFHVYYGKGHLMAKGDKYIIIFEKKISDLNQDSQSLTCSILCVIHKEMFEKYEIHNGKAEELLDAVKEKKTQEIYLYGHLNISEKEGRKTIFINVQGLDFIDIR